MRIGRRSQDVLCSHSVYWLVVALRFEGTENSISPVLSHCSTEIKVPDRVPLVR
jgi:hypothetical protein